MLVRCAPGFGLRHSFVIRHSSFVIFLLAFLLSFAANAAPRPNILFLLVDDMGWGDPACFGGVGEPTPNIDRLAAEGTRFKQFYVASPICSASRTAFTTGNFPSRWRINSYLHERAGNRADDQADWLDPCAPSLARTLKAAGYATGHFGKWHMGGGRDVDDAPLTSAYGFDESLVNSTPLEGPGPALPAGTPRWKTTWLFMERTLDFIKRQQAAGKPFYVNLWFSEVHDAHVPRPEDMDPELMQTERVKKGGYPQSMDGFRRTLRGFDRDLGKFLDELKKLGLEQNTIILFTGDNGPNPLYDAASRARTAGLRGQKWSLYEGGTREAFIVRWPGRVPAGKVNESSVLGSVDFFPTLCALTGVTPPGDAKFDGVDASDALLGKNFTRTKPLFWEFGRTETYIRPKTDNDRSPNVAIRDGDWKLLLNADGTHTELYDLAADRNESRNLATEKPDVAKRLAEQALAWRKSLP
ncbi:MAG: sulfatase-like hydrolase/transferase [Verrucomicrobia bacterium]|nr:sulfatase-like hydrolase/transferase [Verrucomicrobiota bacterium]